MRPLSLLSFFIFLSYFSFGQKPIFTPSTTKSEEIIQNPADCGPDPITFQAKAYSYCTKSPKLRYSYKVFFYGMNGSRQIKGNGNVINLTAANGLTYGNIMITWKVTDACGNSNEVTKFVFLSETKKPNPIAKSIDYEFKGNTIEYKLTADDVNNNSWDNCTSSKDLYYLLGEEGTYSPNMTKEQLEKLKPYIIYNGCKDFGTKKIALFAFDRFNNWNYVEQNVNLTSSLGSYCDTINQSFVGNISSLNDINLKDVNLYYNSIKQDATNFLGNFWFRPKVKITEIKPEYSTYARSSVNSNDLVRIYKHLQNVEQLSNPYTKIASDINNDKVIDSKDYDILREVILFIGNNDSLLINLKFVPKNYIFTTDTFNFPQSIVVDSSDKTTKIDFFAIKMGDATGSFFAEAIDRTALSPLPLTIQNQQFIKNDEVKMKLQLPECEAYSYTFHFDPSKLSFLRMDGLDEKSYNLQRVAEGVITVLYVNGQSNGNTPEFIFKAKLNGNLKESISINSSLTPSEFIKNGEEKSSIYLEFIDEIEQYQLLQNVPNPFTYNTLVKYYAPKEELITWNVLNMNGQKVIQGILESKIGLNEFEVKSEDFTTNGAYILQLITDSGIFSQKIIFIKQ